MSMLIDIIGSSRRRGGAGDADAAAYIAAVEAADDASLEAGVKSAITAFVVGLKADGIWTPIKAACILAGARTLAGALVPLVGAAPTNVDDNFTGSDYSRKLGLTGNGTNTHLDSNRSNTTDPQNDAHHAIYLTTATTTTQTFISTGGTGAGATQVANATGGNFFFRNRSGTANTTSLSGAGLVGMARSNSSNYDARAEQTAQNITRASASPASGNLLIMVRSDLNSTQFSTSTASFYSIGESLNLASLESRIATLMAAFDAAIT